MEPTWKSLKEAIRDLYLVQNEPKGHVMSEIKRLHGFTATEAQYERQLKKWNFRKNPTSKEWAHVARRVEKRKLEGRDSHVLLNGTRVPAEKL
ncbi:Clr5 domain-containing protein [Phyllosticta citrichinensis]|uniref:Clr5 domain-containing protein n=1 Tax=Phyllosticta citrichinensis TaxID=1130410 RepID=A0ABR1Y5G2_9PEZI